MEYIYWPISNIDQFLILTNISKSKGDQAMKPGQLTKALKNMAHFYGWGSNTSRLQSHFEEAEIPEYNLRKIFLEKPWCGGETIPRPFSKKLKLNISLDRNSKVLHILFLLFAKLRTIEIGWN